MKASTLFLFVDHIKFKSSRISAEQLYQYISDHNKLYGLDVFQMNSANFAENRMIIPIIVGDIRVS